MPPGAFCFLSVKGVSALGRAGSPPTACRQLERIHSYPCRILGGAGLQPCDQNVKKRPALATEVKEAGGHSNSETALRLTALENPCSGEWSRSYLRSRSHHRFP